MSTTVLDLITDALMEIGVLASGETATGSDAEQALRHINNILDDAAIDRSKIHQISIDEYTLTPALQPHTIGSGGTFDTSRPSRIVRAYIKTGSGSTADHQEISVWTEQEWSAIRAKGQTADIPEGVYPDYASPLCNLYFWPVPSAANVYEQHSYKQFSELTSLTTVLAYPPGYRSALLYELAVRLCGPFGREIPKSTAALALRSLSALQTINSPDLQMSCDPAILGGGRSYNILTD